MDKRSKLLSKIEEKKKQEIRASRESESWKKGKNGTAVGPFQYIIFTVEKMPIPYILNHKMVQYHRPTNFRFSDQHSRL